jgi:zinc transporter ZupT
MLAGLVYLLGALVTALCAVLLLRGYARSRSRLLLWSGFCFIGLTISNALLFVDLQIFTEVDLYMWRLGTAAGAMLLLVYGLVFESE